MSRARVIGLVARVVVLVTGGLGLTHEAAGATVAADEPPIARWLARRCLSCHSGDSPQGELDLTTRAGALRGGESGPAIGATGGLVGPLWSRIAAGEMPPKHPLPDAEKAFVAKWLEQGALWPEQAIDPLAFSSEDRAGYDWWSFRPVRKPAVPVVAGVAHPIDAFVSVKRTEHGLTANPPASRAVLLRRLTFDLTGLPPTIAEQESWSDDDSPTATEALIDRLLASPHYGERRARHWLDLVRFGESNGFERDLPRPHAWPYRNWVIRALNDDLPYDEFIRWQLAADQWAPDAPEGAAALGFLVAGPHDTVLPVIDRMRQQMRQDELEDLIGTVGQTFLGLTIHCARCHDHKFDPISTGEYYEWVATFAGINHGEKEVRFPSGPLKVYTPTFSQPGPTRVLRRGDVLLTGATVSPAGLKAITEPARDWRLTANAPEPQRRLKFAQWLTDPRHPLTARVLVNRLWQYHFGVGLVETPSDFGFNGGSPSHPELLDWLAAEFVERGWSLKALSRLMVTSATYQQSSAARPDGLATDAQNRWYWRMSPRRIEAEALRDALLHAADRLDARIADRGYSDFRSHFFKGTQFYDPLDGTDPVTFQRTIYRMWARGGRNPLLDTFDCPDPSTTAPRRSSTTTPLQALALMNNPFVLRMADALAEAAKTSGGPDESAQVAQVYRRLLSRPPTADELSRGLALTRSTSLSTLCRGLMNASEFVVID